MLERAAIHPTEYQPGEKRCAPADAGSTDTYFQSVIDAKAPPPPDARGGPIAAVP